MQHCEKCAAHLMDDMYELNGEILCRKCALIPGSIAVFRGIRIMSGELAESHRKIALDSYNRLMAKKRIF